MDGRKQSQFFLKCLFVIRPTSYFEANGFNVMAASFNIKPQDAKRRRLTVKTYKFGKSFNEPDDVRTLPLVKGDNFQKIGPAINKVGLVLGGKSASVRQIQPYDVKFKK